MHASPPGGRSFPVPRNRRFERDLDENGRPRLHKIFPLEEQAAFEREREALSVLAGPGVPTLLGSETGKEKGFRLILPWLGERDLRMETAASGPLPTGRILEIARDLAAILERLHGLSWVHGDVKPANCIPSDSGLTLIDWEASGFLKERRQEDSGRGFTGGTHGFAPPEAYLGVPKTPAFDIYGLGATLHFLLTGFVLETLERGLPDLSLLRRLRPSLPERFGRVLEGMLQPDPRNRPTAAEVRRECEAGPPPDPTLWTWEAALMGAPEPPAPPPPPLADLLALRRPWRARLERLLDALPQTPSDLPPTNICEGAFHFLRRIRLCLVWMPLLPEARRRLERASARLPALLDDLPPAVRRLRSAMDLSEARHLARMATDLCSLLARLQLADRELPARIERCGHAMQSAAKHLEHEEARLRGFLGRISQAEARLDLEEADRLCKEMQRSFSGTNRVTARIRDRLRRLEWLCDRLRRGKKFLDEAERICGGSEAVEERIPETITLHAFLEMIGDAPADEPRAGPHGLNQFARILSELCDSQPKLALGKAVYGLEELRHELTRRALRLLDTMTARLEADPVPIRPLLRDLHEVDRLVLLDGFIDGPEISRGALLDRLEDLRLRIEELAERGRLLAQGARAQVEQGRLTTALYDLERALQAGRDTEEECVDDRELRAEVARLRRLKDDLSAARRRNFELAGLQAELGERGAPLEDRLSILAQREEVLRFLSEHGTPEQKEDLEDELRELFLTRLRIRSEAAESRMREEKDPETRLAIAREMLEVLADPDGDAAALGEATEGLRPMSECWEENYIQARSDVERKHRETRRRRLRRHWALATGSVILLLLSGILLPDLFQGSRAASGSIEFLKRLETVDRPAGIDEILGAGVELPPRVERALNRLRAAWAKLEDKERGPDARWRLEALRGELASWPPGLRPYAEPLLSRLDALLERAR